MDENNGDLVDGGVRSVMVVFGRCDDVVVVVVEGGWGGTGGAADSESWEKRYNIDFNLYSQKYIEKVFPTVLVQVEMLKWLRKYCRVTVHTLLMLRSLSSFD